MKGILIIVAIVILVALIALILAVRKDESYSPQVPRIFLSIASLKDKRCNRTLRNAFAKADEPSALIVGICEQNSSENHMCLREPVKKGEVRVISISADEATGPATARERITRLFQDEEIFMQVDAHTTFVQGWDTIVRKAMENRPSEKCVLTHYPPASDLSVDNATKQDVPVISKIWFTSPNEVMQAAHDYVPAGTYAYSRSSAGGCLIMPGSAIREVPYDPELHHLFQGEELLYGARLYTHGYDLYTPPVNMVLHDYVDEGVEKDESNQLVNSDKFTEGAAHAWDMLRQTYASDRAKRSRDSNRGFGNSRSLTDFFNYIAVDPETQSCAENTEWMKKTNN